MTSAYPITASGTNAVARPAKARNSLGIFNQSTTATVYVAFDTAAVATATAGQITLLPVAASNISFIRWDAGDAQTIPNGAINIIASAAATPVTIIE